MNTHPLIQVCAAKDVPERFKEPLFELYYGQVVQEFGTVERFVPEELKKDLRESTRECMVNTETYLLAVVDDKLVGFLSSDGEAPSRVAALYVHPDYRLKGIGSLLLKTFSKWLDYNPIDLYCLKENEGAMVFYLKQGFVFDKGTTVMSHGVGVVQ